MQHQQINPNLRQKWVILTDDNSHSMSESDDDEDDDNDDGGDVNGSNSNSNDINDISESNDVVVPTIPSTLLTIIPTNHQKTHVHVGRRTRSRLQRESTRANSLSASSVNNESVASVLARLKREEKEQRALERSNERKRLYSEVAGSFRIQRHEGDSRSATSSSKGVKKMGSDSSLQAVINTSRWSSASDAWKAAVGY